MGTIESYFDLLGDAIDVLVTSINDLQLTLGGVRLTFEFLMGGAIATAIIHVILGDADDAQINMFEGSYRSDDY